MIKEFDVKTKESSPYCIVADKDSAFWFMQNKSNKKWKELPAMDQSPNIWFLSRMPGFLSLQKAAINYGSLKLGGNKIGSINYDGIINEFEIENKDCGVFGIVYNDQDSSLWFTQMKANKIGRFDSEMRYTEFEIHIDNI